MPLSIQNDTVIDNVSHAFYGHGSYAFNEQFNLSGGLRYTWEQKKIRGDFIYSDLNLPLLTDPHGKEKFENVSSKITLSYKPGKNFLGYASYASGFKSGGFTGRYVVPATGLLPFEPEFLDTYEVGIKSDWLDNHLRLNGAMFYSDYQDIQVLVFDGPAPQTRNAAKGRIKGVELDVITLVNKNLQFSADIGFIVAEYTRLDAGGVGDNQRQHVCQYPEMVSQSCRDLSNRHKGIRVLADTRGLLLSKQDRQRRNKYTGTDTGSFIFIKF